MPSPTSRVNEIIKLYLAVLTKKGVPVQAAYLFGSQAKGKAEQYSDIDLIVVSPVFHDMPLWKRWEILGDALAEVLEPIEARGYTLEEIAQACQQKTSFLYEILTKPGTIRYTQS